MPKREVNTLDEGGLDESPQTDLLKFVEQIGTFAVCHAGGGAVLVLALAHDEHPVFQVVADLPVIFATAGWSKPQAKMGGDGVEIGLRTVGGEGGDVLFGDIVTLWCSSLIVTTL